MSGAGRINCVIVYLLKLDKTGFLILFNFVAHTCGPDWSICLSSFCFYLEKPFKSLKTLKGFSLGKTKKRVRKAGNVRQKKNKKSPDLKSPDLIFISEIL